MRKEESFAVVLAGFGAGSFEVLKTAFAECKPGCHLRRADDEKDLLACLSKQSDAGDEALFPPLRLLLLALELAKAADYRLLKEIKALEAWRVVPLVVVGKLDEKDIFYCYNFGANSFIAQPSDPQEWKEIVQIICQYWFTVVKTVCWRKRQFS